MADVTVTLSGDEAKLLRAIDKVLKAQAKMGEAAAKAGSQSADGANQAEGALAKFSKSLEESMGSGALGKVAAFAGSFATIGTAIKLVKDEIDKVKDMQKNAVPPQIDLASARKDLIRNMPGAKEGDIKTMIQAASKIAGQTKIDEAIVNRAMANALSASGGNKALSVQSVSLASQYLADKPAAIARYSGSLVDMASITGSSDTLVNQGLLAWIGGQSRVVDPEAQARSIPAALKGSVALGASPKEAAALFAALTTGAKDVMGESSGTAEISMVEQVRKFTQKKLTPEQILSAFENETDPKERRKIGEKIANLRNQKLLPAEIVANLSQSEYSEKIKQLSQRTAPGLPEGMSFGKRIDALQMDPALAKKFLEGATFEKKFVGPIEQLFLDKNSDIAKQYKANLAALPDQAGLSKMGSELMTNFKIDPLEGNASLKRALESAKQRIQTNDTKAAEASITREGLSGVMDALGDGALSGNLKSLGFEVSTRVGQNNVSDKAISMVQDRIGELRNPYVYGYAGISAKSEESLTRDAEAVIVLKQLLEVMNAMRSEAAAKKENSPPQSGGTVRDVVLAPSPSSGGAH